MPSEISQSDKSKDHMILFHMYNLKINKINEPNRNSLTDTENGLMVAKGKEFGGLGEKGEAVNKYKLVVTK